MANLIGTASDTHDWQEQMRPAGKALANSGIIYDLCSNCGKLYYVLEGKRSGRPTRGCLASVKVRHLGHAQRKDYLEQEVRMRKAGTWPGSD